MLSMTLILVLSQLILNTKTFLQTSQSLVTDYTCTISIKSADGEEELSCRCRPLSLDCTKENIAESGRGLVFTDTTARHFWEENKVRYSVTIGKRENVEKTPSAY